ncbi:MAG: alpha/beta hydrolase, partial [Phycisphaerales bacterium]|nr:alpha/beta hydrolase [Phycisphaerales bacterium]
LTRADAFFALGRELGDDAATRRWVWYGDLACAWWPAQGTHDPAEIPPEIPVLVLGSTWDPATPYTWGERVFERQDGARMVRVEGGPHVVYGRGDPCVDDVVDSFVLHHRLPAEPITECQGLEHEYTPLSPRSAVELLDALDGMLSTDTEIYFLPEYASWDGFYPLEIGCPYGGSMVAALSDDGWVEQFGFERCAFVDDFELTGSGEYDVWLDQTTFDAQIGGYADGQLHYSREADGATSVHGRWGGRVVDLGDGP